MASPAMAGTLQWTYPTDWANITGYIVKFSSAGNNYSKTILKSVVVVDDGTVKLNDFESICKMQFGATYAISLTAYNAAGESLPSNTVSFTRPGFTAPGDTLPAGSVITIPNAAVTINIEP